MIPATELPTAILHVSGAARERLLVVAPVVSPKIEVIIRAEVGPGVDVEIRRHPWVKALIADDTLGLILTGSLTPQTTGWALQEDEAQNVEGALLVTEPGEVAAIVASYFGTALRRIGPSSSQ